MLSAIADAWRDRRAELLEQAGQLTQSLNRMATSSTTPEGQTLPGTDVLNNALQQLGPQFDPEWGGFGQAPKFPQAMSSSSACAPTRTTAATGARTVVTTSLDAMASGGMYDHLGGGFARYSVDAFWLVPHFEKMLYDQALLARVYLHAWQQVGEARWRQVLDETIAYVLPRPAPARGRLLVGRGRRLRGDEEGRFYVWTSRRSKRCSAPTSRPAAIEWYGVTEAGNFEGSNILHRPVRGDLERPPEIEEARRAAVRGAVSSASGPASTTRC